MQELPMVLSEKEERHERNSSFEALVLVREKNELWYYAGYSFRALVHHPISIGAGKDFATMAMKLGKNAEEAVILASEFSSTTNNLVDIYHISSKNFFSVDLSKQPFVVPAVR